MLSIQSPLLGHPTYGKLLRRMFAESGRLDFHAIWADSERNARERSILGRLVYHLCFTFSRSNYIRERNADFYSLRSEIGTSYWARRLLARELQTFSPDVLHFHTQALALTSRSEMRRVPTIISADMTSRRTAEQFTLPKWHWTYGLQHRIEESIFREAAALVAFSHYAATSMIRDYGVEPERIFVISPGIDLRFFDEIGTARAQHAQGPLRILFIGGEFDRKGGPVLIDAFLRAFPNDSTIELHVVTGDDVRVPEHSRINVHRGIAAYGPEWRQLYERADIFVLPTRREAYGQVYLEAAAARLPIVGSTVGAGPEIVTEGETGFLVRPGDRDALAEKLLVLANDPQLRQRFGSAARERVEREFDAARNARRFENLSEHVARLRRIDGKWQGPLST